MASEHNPLTFRARAQAEWNVRYSEGAMGCVASKLDINDVHPNMFAVVNVNDVSQ